VIGGIKNLLSQYEKVTILTHLNPDADTIGTALGIYGILKNSGKRVEVVNYDINLPINLDFLPYFVKIKNQIDFDDSLIIACDTGSIDRLGFDLDSREIINIDHHKSNTLYGTVNIVDSTAVSASTVAYMLFRDEFPISKGIATCFYTALLSDTQYFTTSNVTYDTFNIASDLMSCGVDISEVVFNLKQRRSLASLRILSSTLDTLDLYADAKVVFMYVAKDKLKEAGATIQDVVGIVDYGVSLVTTELSIVLVELADVVRVSMRSKHVDILGLAITFGGGGHKHAAGFEVSDITKEDLIGMIKQEIKTKGLLDEKK
jgi:phosphoesterase RecJ-like protein